MEPKYVQAESTVKPISVEIGETTVYLRKNVVTEERTDLQGNVTKYWRYQEAAVKPEDFNAYANELLSINAVKGVNDSEHILQIVKSESDGNDNQMVIMEAIADLYDLISKGR